MDANPLRGGGSRKVGAPRLLFLVIVVLAVAILILAVVERAGRQAQAPQGPAPVYAPKGELVAGFPKDLILDQKAQINSSYTITYNPKLNLLTASFSSATGMADLFGSYEKYLPGNSWQITNKITSYPDSRGLYAQNGAAEVSVTILKTKNGSTVDIGYAAK